MSLSTSTKLTAVFLHNTTKKYVINSILQHIRAINTCCNFIVLHLKYYGIEQSGVNTKWMKGLGFGLICAQTSWFDKGFSDAALLTKGLEIAFVVRAACACGECHNSSIISLVHFNRLGSSL